MVIKLPQEKVAIKLPPERVAINFIKERFTAVLKKIPGKGFLPFGTVILSAPQTLQGGFSSPIPTPKKGKW